MPIHPVLLGCEVIRCPRHFRLRQLAPGKIGFAMHALPGDGPLLTVQPQRAEALRFITAFVACVFWCLIKTTKIFSASFLKTLLFYC